MLRLPALPSGDLDETCPMTESQQEHAEKLSAEAAEVAELEGEPEPTVAASWQQKVAVGSV